MAGLVAFLVAVLFVIMFVSSVIFRTALLHPFKTVFHAIKDPIMYFIHHDYDLFHCGQMACLSAHFGGGKTLTGTHDLATIFRRYNNKKVWDRDLKRFVTQKIHIVSNVEMKNIPTEPLVSLSQTFCIAKRFKKLDLKTFTRTCVICLLDEASGLLNSRAFKDNFSSGMLSDMVVSRHYNLSFMYTSQKFKLTDKLLRDVTQEVIDCRKVWRFMVLEVFDADEMEYALNPKQLQPKYRTGFFISDKDYNAYDTLAVVNQLEKSYNDYLSDEEILARRGELNPDVDLITPRKKLFKRKKSA